MNKYHLLKRHKDRSTLASEVGPHSYNMLISFVYYRDFITCNTLVGLCIGIQVMPVRKSITVFQLHSSQYQVYATLYPLFTVPIGPNILKLFMDNEKCSWNNIDLLNRPCNWSSFPHISGVLHRDVKQENEVMWNHSHVQENSFPRRYSCLDCTWYLFIMIHDTEDHLLF